MRKTKTTTFQNLREALDFAVAYIIPRRHLYVINVYGGGRLCRGQQAAIQIVDQEHVFLDGELGLTLHLSFDPRTCADYYALFQQSPLRNLFAFTPWHGIPCYAAKCGTDVDAALNLSYRVLSTIYLNADALDLEIDVLDEGYWDDYFAD